MNALIISAVIALLVFLAFPTIIEVVDGIRADSIGGDSANN